MGVDRSLKSVDKEVFFASKDGAFFFAGQTFRFFFDLTLIGLG